MPFQHLLIQHGIQSKRTSAYTPMSNAYIEHVHQTLGNVLHIMLHLQRPTLPQVQQFVQNACATTMYATRISAHRSLNHLSPGATVFQRDMLHNTPVIADWLTIHHNQQQLIDKATEYQNCRRCQFDFQPGEQVLIHKPGILQKMALGFDGPYEITQVHTNGMVTIQQSPYITEQVNICRVTPFQP
jgi:hypothetical protein